MKCHNCGDATHRVSACPRPKPKPYSRAQVQCYKCKKLGHYADKCTSDRSAPNPIPVIALPPEYKAYKLNHTLENITVRYVDRNFREYSQSTNAPSPLVDLTYEEPAPSSASSSSNPPDANPSDHDPSPLATDPNRPVCSVCMDSPTNTVFTPCGHACVCKKCSRPLKQCPLCRVKIDKTFHLYL